MGTQNDSGGKVAHTPGPWMVTEGTDVRSERTERFLCSCSTLRSTAEVDRANARLIASAPDLLAAAGIALIALDLDPENSPPQWSKEDAAKYLRAAIAKAGV